MTQNINHNSNQVLDDFIKQVTLKNRGSLPISADLPSSLFQKKSLCDVHGRLPEINFQSIIPKFSLGTASNISYARMETSDIKGGVQGGEGKDYTELDVKEVSATAENITEWIPASIHALNYVDQLRHLIYVILSQSIINKEEKQILNGSGKNKQIEGLTTVAATITTGDTIFDKIAGGLAQIESKGYDPDAIVMHPFLWSSIQASKTKDGTFMFGSPNNELIKRLFGITVVTSSALKSNEFIMGQFSKGCAIYESETTEVSINSQHESFATKGLVAIVADKYVALTIFTPDAFVKGQNEL